MPAVLLGGAMNALSVARTLWRMGVAVDAFSDGVGDDAVRYSRSCRRFYDHPPGQDPATAWRRLLEKCEPSVLLPCCDDGLELIARHRAELQSIGHHPIEANDEIVLAMLDKAHTYDLARRVGVPAPRTRTLRDGRDLTALDEFSFPCAIKPVNSHVFVRRFRPFAKGAVVRSPREVIRIVEPILEQGIPMLLTEVIEGTDETRSYYGYLDQDGTPLAQLTKHKLRQYPIRFGLGTYHVTKWDAEVAEIGLRFVQGVGLWGVGNVELKRDARDGVLKLIECNARFTHVNELVRAAGVDLARVAYSRLVGLPLPPLNGFRSDIAIWFPIEDLHALRDYRHQGELSTSEWARTLLQKQCHAQFDWVDPRPSIVSAGRRVAGVTRRVLTRRGQGSQPSGPGSNPYDSRDGPAWATTS